MVATVQRWCLIKVLGPDGGVLVARVLEGPGFPDLRAVDDVARLALLATRLGGGIALTEVSPAMQELIDLTGLPLEVERQAEPRKEALGIQEIQEEIHPRDLPS
jgi:hypothetical protein